MRWEHATASEFILKRGGSIDPKRYPDEEFDLLSIPAFDRGNPEVTLGSEIGSSKSCIQPNDVLLSKIIPQTRRCWVVPAANERRQIGSGEWIIFRGARFNPNYLRHFLTSDLFHRKFMNTVAGVGGSLMRARPAEVARIKIPLPPLKEQERIAAILDKADAIRRKRQQAIHLADEFLRSVFLDMFGDSINNQKGWPVNKLELWASQEAYSIKAGPFGSALKKEDYVESGYKIYGQEQVIRDNFDYGDYYISQEKYDSLRSCSVKTGDILISLVGTFGQVSVVPESHHPGIINPRLMKITLDHDKALPTFTKYLLTSNATKQILSHHAHGGTMSIVNVGILREIELPRPPIGMQRKFVSIYDQLRKTLILHKVSDSLANAEFLSLSQRAFHGEL